MGYETCLYLVGVKVAPKVLPNIEQALREADKRKNADLSCFLHWVGITSSNTLEFRPDEEDAAIWPECPDDKGFVTSMIGKWYDADKIAAWLCRHCTCGQVILHSREGDGGAFGWEFEKGRIRELELKPSGRWKQLSPATRFNSRKRRCHVPADFRAGKAAALNFLKGQVMKLSKGKANPALAGEVLERKLRS